MFKNKCIKLVYKQILYIKNILDMMKSNLLRNFFKLIKIIGGRGIVVFIFRGDN